jgi:hypothetical protein
MSIAFHFFDTPLFSVIPATLFMFLGFLGANSFCRMTNVSRPCCKERKSTCLMCTAIGAISLAASTSLDTCTDHARCQRLAAFLQSTFVDGTRLFLVFHVYSHWGHFDGCQHFYRHLHWSRILDSCPIRQTFLERQNDNNGAYQFFALTCDKTIRVLHVAI